MTSVVSVWRDALRSAWRGVRGRGRAAVLIVSLLALAIAGNVVMFAFADSLVFRPNPFPEAQRIVSLSGATKPPERIEMRASAGVLESWRREDDLFTAVAAHLNKTVYLKGDGQPLESVRTADVTIDFFDVFGVAPRWGRDFQPGDESDSAAFTVVIAETLARERFGHPAAAVGQRLEATAGTLVVVGVMEQGFAFPNRSYRIWRALDPLGPLTRNVFSLGTLLARATPAVDVDALPRLVAERSLAVGSTSGLMTYAASVESRFVAASSGRATMVFVLAGAALCLLLAACANVASLELARALRQARRYAIQVSLGASRARLAGVAALEGLMLVAAAVAFATGLAWLAFEVLGPSIPESLRMTSSNPVDLDGRAIVAMAVIALATYAVCSLPAIFAATRARAFTLLKSDDRIAAGSRATVALRTALTVSEIALAVALLVGGLLYTRSYQELLAVDKGFDSRSLFSVGWSMPPDYFSTRFDSINFTHRVLEQLRAAPGVDAVTTSGPPPSKGDSPSQIAIEFDGRPPLDPVLLGRKWVDREYFNVVRLPLKQGRLPRAGDPGTDVVVPETFARRFFPDGQAAGRQFRRSSEEGWLTIVGVVGDFRIERTRMPQVSDRELFYYTIQDPAPLPAPGPAVAGATAKPRPVDTGGVTQFRTVTVRMDGRFGERALAAAARAIEPGLAVTVSSVDESYARQNESTRLASQIVSAFSVLAFVVAMAGVFGVMAFLVSGRTREIGIRLALGASVSDIRRLVLNSGARMVALGSLLGVTLAWFSARWIESELFGVSSRAPSIYLAAAAATMAVAMAATWLPARQASRVDPAVTLRHE